jgi:hypothetical protein
MPSISYTLPIIKAEYSLPLYRNLNGWFHCPLKDRLAIQCPLCKGALMLDYMSEGDGHEQWFCGQCDYFFYSFDYSWERKEPDYVDDGKCDHWLCDVSLGTNHKEFDLVYCNCLVMRTGYDYVGFRLPTIFDLFARKHLTLRDNGNHTEIM